MSDINRFWPELTEAQINMEELLILEFLIKQLFYSGLVDIKWFCYTSQLKYVFWLEENVSRVIGQNFMTP